jgi:hypothetical protein
MEINERVETAIGTLTIEGIDTNISMRFNNCKVNGVNYLARLLMLNHDDKFWKICTSREASVRRFNSNKDVTQIAIDKILEVAKIATLNWIESNPEKIVMAKTQSNFAKINRIKNEISSKKEEIHNLEKDLAGLFKTSQDLVIELNNLKDQK